MKVDCQNKAGYWPQGGARARRIIGAGCLVWSALILSASAGAAEAEATDGDAVATVNGEAISDSSLQVMMSTILNNVRPSKRSDIDDAQQMAREQLIVNLAAAQAARQLGLHNDPGVRGVLAYQDAVTLSRAYLKERLRQDPLTDERVKQEYERGLHQGKAQEFHVAHVVVAQKTRAEEVLAALAQGEAFDSVARLYSQDSNAVTNSGDLGWIRIDQMDDFRFVDAVKSLKAGTYTKELVKGPTGWHVVKLIEAPRALEASVAFAGLPDAVKGKLRARATQRQIDQIEKQLLAKATITRSKGLVTYAQPSGGAAPVKAEPGKPAEANPPAP